MQRIPGKNFKTLSNLIPYFLATGNIFREKGTHTTRVQGIFGIILIFLAIFVNQTVIDWCVAHEHLSAITSIGTYFWFFRLLLIASGCALCCTGNSLIIVRRIFGIWVIAFLAMNLITYHYKFLSTKLGLGLPLGQLVITIRHNNLISDHWIKYEPQIRRVREFLRPDEVDVAGYVSSASKEIPEANAHIDFALATRVVAPVLLERSTSHRFVLAHLTDYETSGQSFESRPEVAGLTLLKDFGHGLALFQGKETR